MSGRTLVMGDIHGNLGALKQCLERCRFDLELDALIQLGDVSDRHPYTAEVIEELFKIQRLTALRGNHDAWTRDWLIDGFADTSWLENGGYATIRSYQRNMEAIDVEMHKAFFQSFQQDFYIDDQNRIFVHGGFIHREGPQFEPDSSVCNWDRSLWINTLESLASRTRPAFPENFNEIYLGHTPTLNWQKSEPMNAFNVWNLDTGAGTSGKLTIMDIDTKEYWQSE